MSSSNPPIKKLDKIKVVQHPQIIGADPVRLTLGPSWGPPEGLFGATGLFGKSPAAPKLAVRSPSKILCDLLGGIGNFFVLCFTPEKSASRAAASKAKKSFPGLEGPSGPQSFSDLFSGKIGPETPPHTKKPKSAFQRLSRVQGTGSRKRDFLKKDYSGDFMVYERATYDRR